MVHFEKDILHIDGFVSSLWAPRINKPLVEDDRGLVLAAIHRFPRINPDPGQRNPLNYPLPNKWTERFKRKVVFQHCGSFHDSESLKGEPYSDLRTEAAGSAFAALKGDGSVVCWGGRERCLERRFLLKSVCVLLFEARSPLFRFVFLRRTNRNGKPLLFVFCWGGGGGGALKLTHRIEWFPLLLYREWLKSHPKIGPEDVREMWTSFSGLTGLTQGQGTPFSPLQIPVL